MLGENSDVVDRDGLRNSSWSAPCDRTGNEQEGVLPNVVIEDEWIPETAAEVFARRPDTTLPSISNAAGFGRTPIPYKLATRDARLETLAVDNLRQLSP